MITIIGGGISGLICGYFAKKNGTEVKILEKSNRAGGLIKTKNTTFGPIEYAAHLFRGSPEIITMCNDLGVELLQSHTKSRLFIKNDKITKIPFSIFEISNFLYNILSQKKIMEHENLECASRYYLGNSGFKYFITPFVQGIYACHPEQLSSQVFFDGYQAGERPISFIKKKQESKPSLGIFTPKNGMEDLVHKLSKFLSSEIVYNTEVLNLSDIENPILTCDSYSASKMLAQTHCTESTALKNILYSDVSLLHLFFDAKTHIPHAIGSLSTDHTSNLCGILFNSACFPEKYNEQSITAIFRGNDLPQNKMTDIVCKILRIKRSPIYSNHVVIKNAIPIYSNDLLDTQNLLQKSNIQIHGNYMGSLSLNDITSKYTNFFKKS